MGFTWFGDGWGKTIRFLQAEEDLLRPIPNIVFVRMRRNDLHDGMP